MAVAFFDYMAALRESDLPGPVRSVAFWIAARCANGWPVTRETISEDSGFSRATVTRAIADLREKGWLVSDRNRRQGNSYELAIPRFLSAQSEPMAGSERAFKEAHSEPREAQREPLRKFLSAQSEPTVGSERAFKKAHSEPTYIRTIQEQQEHLRAHAPAHAREDDPTTIKHSNTNQGLLWKWVTALVSTSKGKAEVSKTKRYVKADGSIYKDLVISDLMTSEMLFEHFRPWFERLRAEGRI